jgi:F0F1-type ATP synthase epsilon subunit
MNSTEDQSIENYGTTLQLSVKSPNYVYYNGPAVAVSSFNKTGKFDVLGLHASFITLIQEKVIIYKPDKKQVSIGFSKGVMKVFKNKVQVFIGIELESSNQSNSSHLAQR